jgi:hypothetical protein
MAVAAGGLRSGGPARRRDPFRRRVAYLIVVVSIVGPLVSWRASEASQEAGGLEGAAAQERLRREQSAVELRSRVAEDLRLFGLAQERKSEARLTKRDAGRVGARDLALGRALVRRGELADLGGTALLRTLTVYPATLARDGALVYDVRAAIRATRDQGIDELDLQPDVSHARAAAAQERAAQYLLVGIGLGAALFFLTLAQVTGPRHRRRFAAAGVVVAVASGLLFALA